MSPIKIGKYTLKPIVEPNSFVEFSKRILQKNPIELDSEGYKEKFYDQCGCQEDFKSIFCKKFIFIFLEIFLGFLINQQLLHHLILNTY